MSQFKGQAMLPEAVVTVAAQAAVNLTFAKRPQRLLLKPWAAFTDTLYVRLNAADASKTCGDVIPVTAQSPLSIEGVELDAELSIFNDSAATAFTWSGAGQNGTLIAW